MPSTAQDARARRLGGRLTKGFALQHYVQATVTIVSLVNPVVCGAMFASLDGGRPGSARVGDATKIALTILVVLLTAAIAGSWVLKAFGISLDAFRVAGGGVVTWIGMGMLAGRQSVLSPSAKGSDGTSSSGSQIIPLVLFGAGPGTITGVMTVSVHHSVLGLPLEAIVAVCVAVAVMWGALLVSARMGVKSGVVHDLSTRFMGLLVLAMGVQITMSGALAFVSSAKAASGG